MRGLRNISEAEIRNELTDQDVVGVDRVTVRKNGEVIPSNTLFLTFSSPDLPKEIKMGYLRAKVEMFVQNPLRCFNCNRFGQTSARCRTTAKCVRCVKEKHDGECDGPPNCCNCSGLHAVSAKDCSVWQMAKEVQLIHIEKRISFQVARQLVQAKTPATCTPTSTLYSSVVSKKCVKSVDCQTDLRWVSSDTPTCISGGPGSASVSTEASPDRTRTAGADALLCASPLGRRTNLGPLTPGPVAPTKRHLLTQGTGSKTSPKS